MLDWDKHSTEGITKQELTFKRQRGYWHWRCQRCSRTGQERIPDKAQDHYRHNPGNPTWVICGRCTEYRFDSTRITLNGKCKRKNGKPIKDSQDCDPDSEGISAPWGDYMAIAKRFEYKAIYQDREDLRHSIILTLAEVHSKNGHTPFTQALMHRVASNTVANYWRGQYQHANGANCHNCAKDQRKDCKDNDLYSSCPKAIRLESLSKPIIGYDGDITELGHLIVDDKAIDILDWVEVNTWRLGYPNRLINIADKIRRGDKLTPTDSQYLWRYRKKQQKRLM